MNGIGATRSRPGGRDLRAGTDSSLRVPLPAPRLIFRPEAGKSSCGACTLRVPTRRADQDDAALMRRPLLLFLVVAAGYAAGSQLSYSWFGADGVSASFFPAAGVTLAALVLVGRRLWPVVLAAAAAAEILLDLAHGLDLAPSLGYAAANTVQPLVGALLLTSVRPRVDLARTTDLVAFIACAVVAGPAVGAARRRLHLRVARRRRGLGSASRASGGSATGSACSSSAPRSSRCGRARAPPTALAACPRRSRSPPSPRSPPGRSSGSTGSRSCSSRRRCCWSAASGSTPARSP